MTTEFDVPSGRTLPVDTIRIGLSLAPHPFEADHRAAIDRNWELEIARNPSIFDGEVVLLSGLRLTGAVLAGTAHVVRFRTFLYWRSRRPVPDVAHVFAHAMPVSGDGALIAIRMGPHTVNAGRVYFAAGSFEPQDFHDGLVDLPYNMRREVLEETGLDLAATRCDRRYVLHASETGTVLARRYHFDAPAAELAEAITRFVAAEPDPEIVGPVVIRSGDDLPDGLMAHVKPLLDWHFSGCAASWVT